LTATLLLPLSAAGFDFPPPIHLQPDYNAQGFRASGDVPAKKRTRKRIVCIGDSHVYGQGVTRDEAFPRILERRLQSLAGPDSYEVINAGVPGICILEKLMIYEKNCAGMQHDLLLLHVGIDLPRIAMHIAEESGYIGWLPRSAKELSLKHPRSRLLRRLWEFLLGRESFRLERERIFLKTGEVERETVHGITSLTPDQADPARLLVLNRGQWSIENRSHYVRDMAYDEDRQQVRKKNGPQVMAALRNFAISLLRLAGFTNITSALRACAEDGHDLRVKPGHDVRGRDRHFSPAGYTGPGRGGADEPPGYGSGKLDMEPPG